MRDKYYRRFLESANSGVDSYITIRHDPDVKWPDLNLKIADCNRRVNLWFGLTKKDLRRSRRKLNAIKAMVARVEQIIEMYEMEGK